MEPITLLTYILSSFFGYYVGADIWNHTTDMELIHDRLEIISAQIDVIRSVRSV
jgi:hypothetical protein